VDPKMANMVLSDDEEELVHGDVEGLQMPDENEYLW
jgi:hypothetical protein